MRQYSLGDMIDQARQDFYKFLNNNKNAKETYELCSHCMMGNIMSCCNTNCAAYSARTRIANLFKF